MSKPLASVKLWMPFFIKEHRAKASTLTHTEHSALTYFTMLLWERDGVVPDDDKWIAKQLRLSTRQWKAMKSSIIEDCVVSGGLIEHPDWVAEVQKAKANVEQKRHAGMASAAARKANARSTAVATHVQPRAGSGEGEGPYQEGNDYTQPKDGPFSVLEGGKS